MTTRVKLKEAFEVDTKQTAFFTGGEVIWTPDSQKLLCQNGATISIIDTDSGKVIQTIGDPESEDTEEDTVLTFCLSPDNDSVITAHKSGLIKSWSTTDGSLLKMWRSIHKGPIAKLAISKDEQLATGGSDGAVRLWNLFHQSCTHNLIGSQGVMSILEFHQNSKIKQVFAAGDDTKIRCWSSLDGQLVLTLTGHCSKITCIAFHPDNVHLISSGRDKVLILWNLNTSTAECTLPVYESVEGIALLPKKFEIPDYSSKSNDICIASAGEKGIITVWNLTKTKCIYKQSNSFVTKASVEGGLAITKLLFSKQKNQFAVITADHNIIIHDVKTFDCVKQLVGFSDEILDIVLLGDNDSHMAVATNSIHIKLYTLNTMNCQLVKGHTDLVLALSRSSSNNKLMLSSSKDHSVRLWSLDSQTNTLTCLGVGTRHTSAVGSVAFSHQTASFAASVSQDMCLKLWNISDKKDEDSALNCMRTELAHEKDINCVIVSPNDKLIATGSQDKTAKLWSADDLSLLGTLRGHRRGVWCVRFSPIDQVLLTTSADCTIKLWSISELNCLKTIEGHESSVLKAEFISRGMQIISAGADGLIKLWTIKNSECVTTLDEHNGRVWALTVSANEDVILTGGSDSWLVKWKDVTVEKREEIIRKNAEVALQEQELSNLMKNEQLLKALKLALHLNRPLKTLKIIESVIKKGQDGLSHTIRELDNDQKELLLSTAVKWNTNSKYCQAAQIVLNTLINILQTEEFKPAGLRSIVEAAIPYTDRHLNRLTQLVKDLYFINFTINCMEPNSV